MDIYEARTYRDFVKARIAGGDTLSHRGAARRVAAYLKVHSTYISQVTKGKADFSVDQGARFCSYCKLDNDQVDFFLNLLLRDRAASKEARAHYQGRLDQRLAERQDMKKRWQLTESLNAEQESRYYSSWIPPAIHLFCQLPGSHTEDSITRYFGLDRVLVAKTLQDLAALGLLEQSGLAWKSLRDSVHLGKESPNYIRSHTNWRLKTVSEALQRGAMPGTHYSSVVSMSQSAAKEIERLILEHLEKTRAVVVPSPPERLYVYCLDFYPAGQPSIQPP